MVSKFRVLPSQATLLLSKIPSDIVGEPLEANRLYDAVNVLLSLQVGGLRYFNNETNCLHFFVDS